MQRYIWNTNMDGINCVIQAEDYFHSHPHHNCTFKESGGKMLRAGNTLIKASFYCTNNPAIFQRAHVELKPSLEGWLVEFIPDKEEYWAELEPAWLAFIEEQKLALWTFTAKGSDSVEGVASPPEIIDLTRKKAGKHFDPENIDAYKIVINGGHTNAAYKDAFDSWCKAKNIKEPKAGDRKNFKQRMKGVGARWADIN